MEKKDDRINKKRTLLSGKGIQKEANTRFDKIEINDNDDFKFISEDKVLTKKLNIGIPNTESDGSIFRYVYKNGTVFKSEYLCGKLITIQEYEASEDPLDSLHSKKQEKPKIEKNKKITDFYKLCEDIRNYVSSKKKSNYIEFYDPQWEKLI